MAKKSIQNLPGWVWMYDGEEEWTNSKGVTSTTRHAREVLTGRTASVKQIQGWQKAGQPTNVIPFRRPEVEGRFYTRRTQTKTGKDVVSISFNTLEDLQRYVSSGFLPAQYSRFLVQTKFASSRTPGKEYVSFGKNGRLRRERFASLSQYFFNDGTITDDDWLSIYEKALEFNYNKDSRFYLFATSS